MDLTGTARIYRLVGRRSITGNHVAAVGVYPTGEATCTFNFLDRCASVPATGRSPSRRPVNAACWPHCCSVPTRPSRSASWWRASGPTRPRVTPGRRPTARLQGRIAQ